MRPSFELRPADERLAVDVKNRRPGRRHLHGLSLQHRHTGNASAGNGAFVNTGNHTSTVRLPPEALRPPSEVDAHRSVDSDLPYRPDAIVDAGFVILRGEPVVAPRMLLQNEVQCENARFAIRTGAASVPHGR